MSLKVTLRQLVEGADLTLAQDLQSEYRLSQRFMLDDDFYEGVRAGMLTLTYLLKWHKTTTPM